MNISNIRQNLKVRSVKSIRVVGAVALVMIIVLPLVILNLQAAPVPQVSLASPFTTYIGDGAFITLTFENSGNAIGYGPFIDLVLPRNGADGVYPYNEGFESDGLTYSSAFLENYGTQVPTYTGFFPDAGEGYGCINHPLAVDTLGDPIPVCGTAGDQFVVFELPFASFDPSDSDAVYHINLNLDNKADIDVPLTVYATGGFRYGEDLLDNPGDDPSIYQPYNVNESLPLSWVSSTITPELREISVSKSDNPYEQNHGDDIISGPNFPFTYTINAYNPVSQNAGIADDPVNNFRIIDELPPAIEYVPGSAHVEHAGCSVTTEPTTPLAQNSPNNVLVVTCDYIAGGDNVSVSFDYFVPIYDADGEYLISPTEGYSVMYDNVARAESEWNPYDSRDEIQPITSNNSNDSSTVKPLAIQKTGGIVNNVGDSSITPGDTVEFTLYFQVSDYFAFTNLSVVDVLADGLRFDPSFTPTLSLTRHGTSYETEEVDSNNFEVIDHFTGGDPEVGELDGSQDVVIYLSNELITREVNANGHLMGGCVPEAGTIEGDPNCDIFDEGPTTGTIKLRAIVQEYFTDIEGNLAVDQGDELNNDVDIFGTILDTENVTTTYEEISDGSYWDDELEVADVSKSIYAINGNTDYGSTNLHPGDTVTYRITYPLLTADFEDLTIIDSMPSSGFDVDDPNSDGTADGLSEWTLDLNASATPPAAGTIQLMTGDTFYSLSQSVNPPDGLIPDIILSSGANTIGLDYGTFDDPGSNPATIDFLITVRTTITPLTTELTLENTVTASLNNTASNSFSSSDYAEVTLLQPDVHITKGAVATDNDNAVFVDSDVLVSIVNPYPGDIEFSAPAADTCSRFSGTLTSNGLSGTPITAAARGVEGGDLLTFAIVLENQGPAPHGAFDITVKDSLPSELEYQADSLCITDGTGTELTYSAVNVENTNAFFEDGIVIDDPGATTDPEGAADPYSPDSGRNIIVVVYDVLATYDVEAGSIYTNNASMLNFAALEDGPNYVSESANGNAVIQAGPPEITKSIVDTNLSSTSSNDVAIGEIITYEITLTVPDLTMSDTLIVDTLDSGLAFVGCNSITPSNGNITTDESTDFSSICESPTVTNSGRTIEFDFGKIVNSNTDHDEIDTIVINYDVVVLDGFDNYGGSTLINSVDLTWEEHQLETSADYITVKEPSVSINKSLSTSDADAGDTIGVSITVTANTGSYTTTAYNVAVSDLMPSGFAYIGSLSCTDNSETQSDCSEDSGEVTAIWDSLAPGQSETVTFNVVTLASVEPNDSIYNTAYVDWRSLPDDVSAQSSYNEFSDERNYSDYDYDYVDIPNFTLTKAVATTSEADTTADSGIERLAVGEIVRYRLQARIPEGVSSNFAFMDSIPNGMSFLNDNTAKIAFVSDDDGMTSSTLDPAALECDGEDDNPNLYLTGNQTNVASLTPECALPDAAVSSLLGSNNDTYNNGTDVFFKFGNVTNSDRDSNSEYVVVEFNALVRNVTDNVADYSLVNSFVAIHDSVEEAYSNDITAIVVESNLSFDKTMTSAPVKGGDPIVYELTITNTASGFSAAPAYDITLGDSLPSSLVFDSYNITSAPGYVSEADETDFNNFKLIFNKLSPGDSIVVEVTANVTDDVSAGQEISNTSSILYTSLPGPNGTTSNLTGSDTPGSSGSATGERNGSDGHEGALNKYEASDSTSTDIGIPSIVKNAANPSNLSIGATTTFDIVVTLIEGTTEDLVIEDQIPNGLDYVSYQVITEAAASGGQLSEDFGGTLDAPDVTGGSGSGDDVSFDFGDVLVPVDTGISFLLRVTAVLVNETGNQRGDILTNTASLDFTHAGTESTYTVNAPEGVDITVIEPILTLTKEITSEPENPQGGSTVEYTVTVAHDEDSDATAYDVSIADTLPNSLTNITVVSVDATGISDPTSEVDGNTVHIPNLEDGTFDLPVGASVVVVYQADVVGDAQAKLTIDNTAVVNWTSTNGDNANERNGSDGLYDYSDESSNGLNDYKAEDSESFNLIEPEFDKVTPSQTDYAIGDTVIFDMFVHIPEGVTEDVAVNDFVPTGLKYTGYEIVDTEGSLLENDFGGTVPTPEVTGGASDGADIAFEFGDIDNISDADTTNDIFVLRVSMVVSNISANQKGVVLTNAAALDFTNPNSESTDTVSDPTSAQITVIEPVLTLSKEITDLSEDPQGGSIVEYEVTVAHHVSSNATAYDVVITDALPASLTNVQVLSVDVTAIDETTSEVDGTTVLVPNSAEDPLNLPTGATLVITYQAEVVDDAQPLLDIDNTAVVTWTSTSGANADERNGSNGLYDLTNLSVNGLNDYKAQDSDGFSLISPEFVKTGPVETNYPIGAQASFDLHITIPNGVTDDVVVNDIVPTGLKYNGYEIIDDDFGGTVPTPDVTGGTLDGDDLSFDFGNIDNSVDADPDNNEFILRVTFIVSNVSTNQKGTTLSNSANFEFTNPNTSETDQLSGGDPASVTVIEPILALTKQISSLSEDPQGGSIVEYEVTVAHHANSNATAYEVAISDELSAAFTNVNILSVDGTGISDPSYEVDGNTIHVPDLEDLTFDLPQGASVTVVYQAEVVDNVNAGLNIDNTAKVMWTSTNGDNANERNGSDGVYALSENNANGLNDYRSEDFEDFNIILPTVNKVTPSTTQYPIGSSVTFDIHVTIPNGVTVDTVINDIIPTGLTYSSYAIVNTQGGLLAEDFGGTVPTPSVTGGESDEDDVAFDFGSIDNSADSATDNNEFVLQVTAIVSNIAANQKGTTLTNSVNLQFTNPNTSETDTITDLDSTPAQITVIEPILTITKQITDIPEEPQGGSIVEYTVTVGHHVNSNAPAYDVSINDELPDSLINVTILSIDATGISDPSGEVDGNTVYVPNLEDGTFDLPLATSLVIVYQAEVRADVPASLVVNNTAKVTWTSTNGDNANERNGNDGVYALAENNANGLNDYRVEDSESFDVEGPVFDKTTPTQTNYAIGDSVTYDIHVVVPEGITEDVVINDAVPTGLKYSSYAIVDEEGDLLENDFGGTVPTPEVSGGSSDGDDVSFDFGNIDNTADADTTNNEFVLQVTMIVSNITANQRDSVLTNTANLQFTNPNTSETDTITDPTSAQITVIEPVLTLTKEITNLSENPQGGSIVEYEVTVAHHANSNSTAYDVLISDALPASLTNIQVLSVDVTGIGETTSEVDGNTVAIPNSEDTLDLPIGTSLVITYQAEVVDDAQPLLDIDNTAVVTWTSMSGDNANERNGSNGLYDFTNAGVNGLNDYKAQDSDEFSLISPEFIKTGPEQTNYPIGSQATYDLYITIPNGVAHDVVVNDIVPTGLTYGSFEIIDDGFGGTVLTPEVSGGASDGDDVSFDFGNIDNSADADPDNNEFILRVYLRVSNIAANQKGTTLSNSANLQFTNPNTSETDQLSGGDPVDITVIEPILTLSKEITDLSENPQGGSIVEYTVNVAHHEGSNSTAYDVAISDELPSTLTNVTILSVDATGISDPSSEVDGNTIHVSDLEDLTFDLPTGASVNIIYQAEVVSDVESLLDIGNTAKVTWTSTDGDNANERNGSNGLYALGENNANGLNDYNAEDSDEFSIISPAFDQVGPVETNYPIGAQISYDMHITIPNGITANVVVNDTVPTGLTYSGFEIIDDDFGGTVFTPSVTGGASDGDDLSFDFGNIDNSADTNPENNEFILRVILFVSNITGNQKGTTRNNLANLQFTNSNTEGTDTLSDLTPVQITVVEPVLTLAKELTNLSDNQQGGSIVEYQITVAHDASSNSTAYDVIISDQLPESLTNAQVLSIDVEGIDEPSSQTNDDVVRIPHSDDALDLPVGASLVITYQVQVSADVRPLLEIDNTAVVTWTSTSGANVNERNGSDGIYDYTNEGLNGLNDYSGQDSESFDLVAPQMDKVTPEVSTYSIGQSIPFDIHITIPNGITDDVVVTDTIPEGLKYDSFEIIDEDFGGTVPTPSVNGGEENGDDVSFDFGSIDNSADSNQDNNEFILRVNIVVLNLIGTQQGSSFDNYASMDYQNPNTLEPQTLEDDEPAEITVIEPILDITKTAIEYPTEVEAGSAITYQIHVSHNSESNSNAYNLVITDPASDQLTNITDVDIQVEGIDVPSYEVVEDQLRIPSSEDSSFDLPLGATITITYNAHVDLSVGPTEMISNDANVIWTSAAGSNENERTSGDGNYDYSESGANGLNDYRVEDSDGTVSTIEPTIQKLLVSSSSSYTADNTDPVEVAIGETLTFLLKVQVPEGTIPSITMFDEFPDNLEYVSSQLVTLAADSNGGLSANFNGTVDSLFTYTEVGDGNDLEFEILDIVNGIDGQGQNNSFGIKVVAVVKDSVDNNGLGEQTIFTNTLIGESGEIELDGGAITFVVVEPSTYITKEFEVDAASPFTVLHVTSVVGNQGTGNVFDTVWTDNLDLLSPGSMIYQTGSLEANCTAGVTTSPTINDSDLPTLSVSISNLPDGESCTITYYVALLGTLTDEDVVENRATISGMSTLSGTVEGERTYESASDEDLLEVQVPDLTISKFSDIETSIGVDNTINYTLTVDNIGTYPADNITVTETVPANTNFNDEASTFGWNCAPNYLAGSTCTFNLSSFIDGVLMPADDPVSINFAVNINNTLPANTVEIYNEASVSDDGGDGADPTPENNTADYYDSISEEFMPNLVITKTDNDISVHTNEILTYQISYENIGNLGTTGVVISETVPVGTEYAPDENDDEWVCTPDNLEGSICELSIGTLQPGDSGSVSFSVLVTMYLPDIVDVENTIEINDDGINGFDANPENNIDTESTPVLYTYVYDPPSAQKIVNDDGSADIEWKMVWINDGNDIAINTLIVDPIPVGTIYVPNSFICDARGASVTTRCEYNSVDNQVEWEGDIAPDLGGTDEDDSENEVVLILKTTVPPELDTAENQAYAYWDGNGNGDYYDDMELGQEAIFTTNPNSVGDDESYPTVWVRPEALIDTGFNLMDRIYFVIAIVVILVIVWRLNLGKILKRRFSKK